MDDPSTRDPRLYPWGYYSVDDHGPPAHGVGVLLWFGSGEEMVEYLVAQHHVVTNLREGEEVTVLGRDLRAAYAQVAGSRASLDVARSAVNQRLKGLYQAE